MTVEFDDLQVETSESWVYAVCYIDTDVRVPTGYAFTLERG